MPAQKIPLLRAVAVLFFKLPESDGTPFLVVKASQNDADDIYHLPNDKTTDGQELDDTGNNFTGIYTVYTTETAEKKQGKQQGGQTGTGR